jgi:hypothetical protein
MLENPRIGLDTAREKIILSLAMKPENHLGIESKNG